MMAVIQKSTAIKVVQSSMIIIIIILFQEDNIFDTDLTYGPPLTDVDMLLKK